MELAGGRRAAGQSPSQRLSAIACGKSRLQRCARPAAPTAATRRPSARTTGPCSRGAGPAQSPGRQRRR
eukprot:4243689-Pyramimonas_sp.AAC.1